MDNIDSSSFQTTLIVGTSVDGKVTYRPGGSSKAFGTLLSHEMNEPLRKWRLWADALLVSRKTILYDDSSLTIPDKELTRIVVDRKLQLPSDRKIFDQSAPTIVITENSSGKRTGRYPSDIDFMIFDFVKETVLGDALKSQLQQRGISHLLIEGGGEFNAIAIKNKFIDTLVVAIFPFLIGGRKTPTLLDGNPLSDIREAVELDLLSSKTVSGMIVTEYNVNYK